MYTYEIKLDRVIDGDTIDAEIDLGFDVSIKKNYSMYPNRNKWKCDCHVIHDYDQNVYPIDYLFLRKEYEKLAKKVCKKFKS